MTPVEEQEQILQTDSCASEIDSGYAVFVSDGYVSLVGSELKVPVKILRDSGALDSFILDSVLPFSHASYTGSSVEVKGMGLTVFAAPQHKLTCLYLAVTW